jgi:hypothetical protein
MKRTVIQRQEVIEPPSAWSEAEYAALRNDAADLCDDRVSQNMFDADDEREEVDSVTHGMDFGVN